MARPKRPVREVGGYEQPLMTPAMNLEDQEDQLVSLAVDLAMKRLREGTASNQLISEIIKLGTVKERLSREKLQRENDMLRAKTEAIEASRRNAELYENAINAMRVYSGFSEEEDDEFEDY